jgi:hypothetical protein
MLEKFWASCENYEGISYGDFSGKFEVFAPGVGKVGEIKSKNLADYRKKLAKYVKEYGEEIIVERA